MAHELAAALDQRARVLGEQLAASPEPWLANQLGILAPHASPRLREDYARRAAAAAAYREAAGITDPGQAIAPEPHRGNPELDHLRRTAIRALEIRDETEIIRGMTHGELEARILDGERAQASAPPDVSRELRLTAQAEADAWQQSADAEIKHDPAGSAGATALARHMAAQREQLEAANAHYGHGPRHQQQEGSSRESQGRAGAARSSRSRQLDSGKPSPKTNRRPWWSGGGSSKPTSPPWTGPSSASTGRDRRRQALATPAHRPGRAPAHAGARKQPAAGQAANGQSGPDDQAARLDGLLAQTTEAAQRFTAENADREARAQYAARLEQEAYAEPEHTAQAEACTRQKSSCKYVYIPRCLRLLDSMSVDGAVSAPCRRQRAGAPVLHTADTTAAGSRYLNVIPMCMA